MRRTIASWATHHGGCAYSTRRRLVSPASVLPLCCRGGTEGPRWTSVRWCSTTAASSSAPIRRQPSKGGRGRRQRPAPSSPRPPRRGEAASTRSAEDSTSSSPPRTTAAATEEEGGWAYESVDPDTGMAPLETLYASHHARIQRVLEQPLPRLPQDGSVSPDLMVGFAHYSYTLRDEYRAVVARELQVPVQAVRLSVAWSGRFDVSRFHASQKVCGVVLRRSLLTDTAASTAAKGGDGGKKAGTKEEEAEQLPLPEAVQQRMTAFIQRVNAKQSEQLLRCQMVQASEATPEVEFALTKVEHRRLSRLQQWLAAHLWRQHTAVFVCGPQQQVDGSMAAPPPAALVESWTEASIQQRTMVETQWLKLFHSRRVVPAVWILPDLAWRMAVEMEAAVASAPVPTSTEDEDDAGADVGPTETPIPGELLQPYQVFLTWARERAAASPDVEGPPPTSSPPAANCFSSAEAFAQLTEEQQVAACKWLAVVQTAVGYHVSGAYDPVSGFPALFVHGAHAGSTPQLRYLKQNGHALDALLLHPHDLTFKRTFASRLRNGHRRLRMHEEIAGGSSADTS